MKFNRNESYILYKEPNGRQLGRSTDKLFMILAFILFQKEKDPFTALSNFKKQINTLNILNNDNDVYFYLGFLLEFNDRKNLVEINEKIKADKTIAYLCCS